MFIKNNNQTLTTNDLLSWFLIGLVLLIALGSNFLVRVDQQFTYLGSAFLQGHLYFSSLPANSIHDIVVYRHHLYWASGFLPPLLFMPFVALSQLVGFFFLQGYLQFFITVLIFVLTIRLAQHHGFSKTDARYLAFAFVSSS